MRKLFRNKFTYIVAMTLVCAMTANAFAEDIKNALSAGMNAHIAKPIDPQKLYETLAAYIK